MLTKKSFDDVVFPAIYKMGDYFSSFGGAARPSNFVESDIATYVICYLLKGYDCYFPLDSYVIRDLANPKENDIKDLLDKVNVILSNIEIDDSSIYLLVDFWNFYDMKYERNHKSERWIELKSRIESYS